MEALNQREVPIYFDTSMLWRVQIITRLRADFPARSLCVPTVAHFERVRQLQRKHGADFDQKEIWSFIQTHNLTLVDLNRQAADLMAQIACRLEDDGQPWKPLALQDVVKQPCGQRCRLADYVIAATAKVGDGILLTNDEEILVTSEKYPDLFPVAMSADDVQTQLTLDE
jgi:predicted nucleic acid-binding protein